MNPFDYLGVPNDAGLQDAKSAYRRLAKACHPDQHPDDPDAPRKFALLHEAYTEAIKQIAARPAEAYPGRGPSASSARRKPPSSRTVWRDVEIDVAMALSGGEVTIPGASGVCDHCQGEGRIPLGHETECATCEGSGKSGTRYGAYISVSIQCHECDGTGRTIFVPCHRCGGFGVSSTTECRTTLPPNVREGDTFRIDGAASIPSENVRGDVQIMVKVVDRSYRIVGDDVETTVMLDLWDAANGGAVAVMQPGGDKVTLKYPAGTAHGRRFRMPGRGMERLSAAGRGDFVVVAAIRPVVNSNPEIAAALEALRLAVLAERRTGQPSR